MTKRRCWTCNTEHDLDEACPQSPTARGRRAAGALDDFTATGLFGADPSPGMPAQFESECPECGEMIWAGETIKRGSDDNGFVHEECAE